MPVPYLLVAFPAEFKLISWTNSTAREKKRQRQPWYLLEDHDTLEAKWFYSLDATQHCIKIKDLNVGYKSIEDSGQNYDSLPGTCPCDASTDPMAKYQESSDSFHKQMLCKHFTGRAGYSGLIS